MISGNSHGGYKVVYPETIREAIRQWTERAPALGITHALLTALKTIHAHLKGDPLEWGDPCYHLHQLGLLVHQQVQDRLFVMYAVDEPRHIVYVMQIRPLSSHPLGGNP